MDHVLEAESIGFTITSSCSLNLYFIYYTSDAFLEYSTSHEHSIFAHGKSCILNAPMRVGVVLGSSIFRSMAEIPQNVSCYGKYPLYNKQFITLVARYKNDNSLSHLCCHLSSLVKILTHEHVH